MIPEDLGYVHGDKPGAEDILEGAKLDLAVRDGYASFFFHPFLSADYLKTIVKGLRAMGYKFGDIRDFSPVVEDREAVVLTPGDHHIRIQTHDNCITMKEIDFKGNILKNSVLPIAKNPYEANIECPRSTYLVITGQGANNGNNISRN